MTGLAIADLSNRLSIDRSAVHLLSTESTTWPDSSLGCPQPGGLYNRILIEGYLIRLEANDQIIAYHTGGKDLVGLYSVKEPNEFRTLP